MREPHRLVRRVAVTAAYLVCLAGTAVGVGALGGTPVAEAAGGLLSADATHLAPASPAFSVWSVIYAALAAYTVWQWWDGDRRRVAWLAAASMILNAGWILLVQAGLIWLTVLVIAALLAVLAEIFRRTAAATPAGALEAAVVDGTFGLYLGWVCVATCANVAAALAGTGFTGFGAPGVLAGAVLAGAGAVGVALAVHGGGRIAVAATLVWGLAWIAVGRTTSEPESPVTAAAAILAGVVVLAGTLVVRLRRPGTPLPARTSDVEARP